MDNKLLGGVVRRSPGPIFCAPSLPRAPGLWNSHGDLGPARACLAGRVAPRADCLCSSIDAEQYKYGKNRVEADARRLQTREDELLQKKETLRNRLAQLRKERRDLRAAIEVNAGRKGSGQPVPLDGPCSAQETGGPRYGVTGVCLLQADGATDGSWPGTPGLGPPFPVVGHWTQLRSR